MWVSLEVSEKAELRHFLMDHLLRCHASYPPFIQNKIIKVLVFIGRYDWPHHYPEFLSHVLQVGSSFIDSHVLQVGSPPILLIIPTARSQQ